MRAVIELQVEKATTVHACDPCADTEMAEGSLWVTLARGYSLLGNSPTEADSQASSAQSLGANSYEAQLCLGTVCASLAVPVVSLHGHPQSQDSGGPGMVLGS